MKTIPPELIEDIINYYGDGNINLVNSRFNEAYQQASYHNLVDILKSKYKNFSIPEYNNKVNWGYEYKNILFYENYLDLMKDEYPMIPPIKPNYYLKLILLI